MSTTTYATTAFVLSGGAVLGAAQVGMLMALAEEGLEPDLIVGTSVGAVNGAWIAGHPGPRGVAGLADIWRRIRRDDVFPTRPLTGLLGLTGHRSHLIPDTGLRRLVARHLDFELLEDAPVPLHVIAADVQTGTDVRLDSGTALEAVLASTSIPGLFPPVAIAGHVLMDGGVVNNTPISHAVELGATTVWVLSTGYACALEEPPRGALAMALHALTLTINQRLALDVERYEATVDLRVVPPLCPIRTTPADFGHGAELIERTYRTTRAWLARGGTTPGSQAGLLEPHDHATLPFYEAEAPEGTVGSRNRSRSAGVPGA
jgi:NTE family protein